MEVSQGMVIMNSEPGLPEPTTAGPDSREVATHVGRLLSSHERVTGRPLLEASPGESGAETARRL